MQKAADLSQNRAEYNLGSFYATGSSGFEKNSEKSIKWYTDAANHGNIKAIANLGVMYHLGQEIEKDEVKSKRYIDMAQQIDPEYTTDFLKKLGIDV